MNFIGQVIVLAVMSGAVAFNGYQLSESKSDKLIARERAKVISLENSLFGFIRLYDQAKADSNSCAKVRDDANQAAAKFADQTLRIEAQMRTDGCPNVSPISSTWNVGTRWGSK